MSLEQSSIATRKVYSNQLCINVFIATDQRGLKKGNLIVNRVVKSMNYDKYGVSGKVLM